MTRKHSLQKAHATGLKICENEIRKLESDNAALRSEIRRLRYKLISYESLYGQLPEIECDNETNGNEISELSMSEEQDATHEEEHLERYKTYKHNRIH